MAKEESKYENPRSVIGPPPPPPEIFTEGLAEQLANERDPKYQERAAKRAASKG